MRKPKYWFRPIPPMPRADDYINSSCHLTKDEWLFIVKKYGRAINAWERDWRWF